MDDDAPFREFQRRTAKVDDQIRQADMLEGMRQIDQAQDAYNTCFDIAREQHVPIQMHQLAHIWMGLGFCYADRNQYDQALGMYRRVEEMLNAFVTVRDDPSISKQDPKVIGDWFTYIPKGLEVFAHQNFDPASQLPSVHESIGLAYDNMEQPVQAQTYFQKAIDAHAQNKNQEGLLRVSHYQLVGRRRRQDWSGLKKAGEVMLQLGVSSSNDVAQIVALQGLAQANANEARMLTAVNFLAQAVEIERKTNHDALAKDEKLLASLWHVIDKTVREASQRPGNPAKPLDPATFKPYTAIFDALNVEISTERGAPEVIWVLKVRAMEKAQQALRLFPMLPMPLDVAYMRQIAGGTAGGVFPQDVDFRVDWTFYDFDPIERLAQTVIPLNMRATLMEANAASRHFSLVVEESQGTSGGAKRETQTTYAPYIMDWYGIEGVATLVRSTWSGVDNLHVQGLLDVLKRRLDTYGKATGLLTQMGFLYRLAGQYDQATACYIEEIRTGLLSDGRPGLGAMVAFCNLATVYKKLMNVEQARLAYKLALWLDPNYFDALISVSGLLPRIDEQLACISRAYLIRPDERLFTTVIQAFCGDYTRLVTDVFEVVKKTAREIDLFQPMTGLTLDDPAGAIQKLISDSGQPAPTTNVGGSLQLQSLEQVSQILARFIGEWSGSTGQNWAITIEESLLFEPGGTIVKLPCAVLQLADDPQIVIQGSLKDRNCTVSLMKEFTIPNVPKKALKSVAKETVLAQADAVFKVLNGWVADGTLYQSGGQYQTK